MMTKKYRKANQQAPSVHELELMVYRMDKGMRGSAHTKERQAAIIMLGAVYGTFEQSVDDITAKAGFNHYWTSKVVDNLRANGIWKKGKTYSHWFDKKHGGI